MAKGTTIPTPELTTAEKQELRVQTAEFMAKNANENVVTTTREAVRRLRGLLDSVDGYLACDAAPTALSVLADVLEGTITRDLRAAQTTAQQANQLARQLRALLNAE